MARRTKFTPDRSERFLAAYRAGVYPETAAQHAGWSPATYYRILRGTTPAHVAFQEEVRRVETELELRLVGTVTQAAFRDPRIALSLLERRFGERWGRSGRPLLAATKMSPEPSGAHDIVIVEPALIEALVPVMLTERLGPATSLEAVQRVERFSLRPGDEE